MAGIVGTNQATTSTISFLHIHPLLRSQRESQSHSLPACAMQRAPKSMASRPCARLAACVVFVVCAVATAVVYTTYPSTPCRSPLWRRAALAISRLDPYYTVSCAEDAALVTDGGGGGGSAQERRVGGPLVTSQHACVQAQLPAGALPPFYCCPPVSASEPINFTLPDRSEPLRVRRPVHAVGAEHMAKYERVIGMMKALPPSDPHSFFQLANVHCAYCHGYYRQTGDPELALQIHFSWFFFPFHRAYLYFFERIAARLLGEPGFALPFWSWDVPEGMRMPPEFDNASSPLYDPIRNPRHAPPKVIDLEFGRSGIENNLTDEQQIQQNLRVMYKQMISNAPLPSLFLGQPFRAGQADSPGSGTVELTPHNKVHSWTGNITQASFENMGAYYSSGRDPIFFPHHSNIDRLWEAWRDVGASRGYRGHVDYMDPDWLDSSFLFYDEEYRLVRITVRDVLDTDKLRYRFDGVGMPWADARPPVTPGVNQKEGLLESVRFPVSLDAAVTVELMRPRVLRNRHEKEVEEEVLVLEGIESDGTDIVDFDVYVNAMAYENVEPGGREMAGSYTSLTRPSMDGTGMGMRIETSMRVALNELLEDLGADADQSVTVTIVPRGGKVKIRSVRIEYIVE